MWEKKDGKMRTTPMRHERDTFVENEDREF